MFGTKNLDTAERSNVSKYLNHGINKAKINSIIVEKARNTDSKRFVFVLEGIPIADKGFEGIDGAKGCIGRMTTSYMKTDAQYQDFMRQVGVLADKLGVRAQVDSVTANNIEEYINNVSPFLTGKFLWWNIGAEEYKKNRFSLHLLRYDFVKSLTEIDDTTLVHDGYITVEARNAAGVLVLRFDKTNKYHMIAFVEPDAGYELPGAVSAAQTFATPSFIPSNDPKPFNVDDLPFGAGEVSDLPFGN